jgi:hypothetical protein
MNDQVLELICKLANKLREYEYEAAKCGDTDERNLESNIHSTSLIRSKKETAACSTGCERLFRKDL